MDETITLQTNVDLIYALIKRYNPKSKITKEQIGDLLAEMVVEALENTTKRTVKELEELWGIC